MLYKTLFVLTIVASFAGLLYGSGGPNPIINPTIPTFAPNITSVPQPGVNSNFTVYYSSNGPDSPHNSSGCGDFWYNCIQSPQSGFRHNSSSYANFNSEFDVILQDGFPVLGGVVQGVTISVSCFDLLVGGGDGLQLNFSNNAGIFLQINRYPICLSTPTGGAPFVTAIWTIPIANISITTFLSASLSIDTYGPLPHNHDMTRLWWLGFQFYVTRSITTSCSVGDTVCAITHSFDAVVSPFWGLAIGFWNGLQLAWAALIWLGQAIIFGISIVINFFGVIAWLYTIPGVPTVIQAFIDGVLTTWFAVIGVELVKLIKPFS